jgi:hypothetical protein
VPKNIPIYPLIFSIVPLTHLGERGGELLPCVHGWTPLISDFSIFQVIFPLPEKLGNETLAWAGYAGTPSG